MTSTPRRRFTIADAMILVAATAVGFVVLWSKGMPFSPSVDKRSWLRVANLVLEANWTTLPFLMTWAPTLLILGLMPPRPGLRRLFRQPGMSACASATLMIAIQLIPVAIFALTIGVERAASKGFVPGMGHMVLTYARNVPFAIGGAWATLVLCGLWRPERTWIDCAGRILGIVWIAGQFVEEGVVLCVALLLR